VPITAGMHTDGGAVIKKPGSAWLEGTLAIDLGLCFFVWTHECCFQFNLIYFFFWFFSFWIHTPSAPGTAGTRTNGGAVIQ